MIRKTLYKWFGVVDALHVSYDTGEHNKPVFVFIHGIGSSAAMWQQVVTEFQKVTDARIIGVDLLGFGQSPKPDWVTYTTQDHAKALTATLRRRGVRKATLVGHSLGALVAVEFAKIHPRKVEALFLCSPPLYTLDDARKWTRDNIYKKLYEKIRERQDRTLVMGQLLATKLRPNRGFMLNEETLPAFMKSLEKSIEEQSTIQDISRLQTPTTILYGKLDPIIISKNIKAVAKTNSRVSTVSILTGHEIGASYAKVLLQVLETYVEQKTSKTHP